MSVISGLKTNAVTIGTSNTDSNNFQLRSNADGTATLARKSDGSGGDVLTIDGGGIVTATQGIVTNRMVLGTAQNTTSGTSIDFTGIPSWVKRITVMFNGVSTSGTSPLLVQIGSGSISSTVYVSACTRVGNASAAAVSTVGYLITADTGPASIYHGSVTLFLQDSLKWTATVMLGRTDDGYSQVGGGSKTLSGTLDRLRLTTVNGTDTFDAGSVNIMYEG